MITEQTQRGHLQYKAAAIYLRHLQIPTSSSIHSPPSSFASSSSSALSPVGAHSDVSRTDSRPPWTRWQSPRLMKVWDSWLVALYSQHMAADEPLIAAAVASGNFRVRNSRQTGSMRIQSQSSTRIPHATANSSATSLCSCFNSSGSSKYSCRSRHAPESTAAARALKYSDRSCWFQ